MSRRPSAPILTAALAFALLSAAQARVPAQLVPDPPIACQGCEEWNAPMAPFKVFGNTYFVGTAGLSSLLIATDDGLILLDGGLPQSAPLIDANIRTLGFRTGDIKLILTSHAHFDHVGGVAALQRLTGATVAGSSATARAMALGHPTADDPQFGGGDSRAQDFPSLAGVRSVADRELLQLGSVAVTAQHTPGHTPGSTSWTWRSCESERCLDMVYGDSLTAVSLGDFRYTGSATTPSIADSFRRSISRVAELPCDVLVTTHPGAAGLGAKLRARMTSANPDPFIDPSACRAYAERAMKALEERLAAESTLR